MVQVAKKVVLTIETHANKYYANMRFLAGAGVGQNPMTASHAAQTIKRYSWIIQVVMSALLSDVTHWAIMQS